MEVGKVISKVTSRKRARRIWEQCNNATILPKMHIHHKDGNPFNNEINNLQICTPEEHWLIHYTQGDPIAFHGKFIIKANNYYLLSKEDQKKKMTNLSKAQSLKWKNDIAWRNEKILSMSGKGNPFFGKTHSEETRNKIRNNKKVLKGKDHYLYGKKHKEDTIIKIRASRVGKTAGKNNSRWIGYVFTPFGRFDTAYEAAKILNISRRTVEYRCKKLIITWKDWYFSKDSTITNSPKII